jgi:tetratricopeptide (TPR) repeat protein
MERAVTLWQQAYAVHMEGRLDEAIELYTRSIQECPTAEAYTYRGWARAHGGDVDEAMADCHRAIEVDPEFGNPYNDIGSYLVSKGEPEAAIPWLERAKKASRYEPRHFPFLNLGRIYLKMGRYGQALEEFQGALQLNPDDAGTARVVQELRMRLN